MIRYMHLFRAVGFFDWKDRHYQVEETVLKDNELIQGYMMTIVDVTKIIEQNHLMKRLVLQTEDANRAKTNFVSNMSHEIRTPMTLLWELQRFYCVPGIHRRSRNIC